MRIPESVKPVIRSSFRRYRFIWIIIAVFILFLTLSYSWAVINKKKILTSALSALNQNLNGTASVGNIEFSIFDRFPNISLQLEDISVTDTLASINIDTVFTAKKISLQIKILSLFTRQPSFHSLKIDNALISLLKTSDGHSNTEIIKRKPSDNTSGNARFSLDKIFMRNVTFRLMDSMKQKFFSFTWEHATWDINMRDSTFIIVMNDRVHFDQLAFNMSKGGYLANQNGSLKTRLEFTPAISQLIIRRGKLKLPKEEFDISGVFEFSSLQTLSLHIATKKITTEAVYSLIPASMRDKISKFSLDKPCMAQAFIKGSLKPASLPAVDIYFSTDNNHAEFANLTFDSLKLLGWFTNHVDSMRLYDDHNTKIYLPVFNASIFNFSMKSKLIITDLINPSLFMNARIDVSSKEASDALDPDRFDLTSGIANLQFTFNGPLLQFANRTNQKLDAALKGEMKIHDWGMNYLPTGYKFRKVNASFKFNENDLQIDTLSMEVNHNRLSMRGGIEKFIPFLFLPEVQVNALVNAYADTLNFNSFRRPAEVADSLKKHHERKNHKSVHQTIASTVDRIVDQLELQLSVHANRVVASKFIATQISGKVAIANDYFKIQELSMNTEGGAIELSGAVTKLSHDVHPINFTAKITNADISSLMYSFDNFQQNTVTNENIDGKLSAAIEFSALLTRNYKVVSSSIQGNIELKITEGQLRDFESLNQISKYIFKNRDFNNIEFAELNNTYSINGSEMNIAKLEVYSSVLTFFVEGVFDLNRSKTHLVIQVPFSNLNKKEVIVSLMQHDSTTKRANSVYLRATNGEEGKIKIQPVIFGKKKLVSDLSLNSPWKDTEPSDSSRKAKQKPN